MSLNILFSANDANWQAYQTPLTREIHEIAPTANLSRDHAPSETDVIVYAPSGGLKDFTPFTKCQAVLSLWAGVEKIVNIPSLTMPLARMVDPGLSQGMMEWVTGHCMRYHLGIDANLAAQNGLWQPQTPPLAQERNITILGLGQLGATCAKQLSHLGFNVTGWSRSPKSIKGVTCLSGTDTLPQALATAEIVVLLLPNTSATENTLNAQTLAMLPKGACILNPGRGNLIDDAALINALNSGHIAHATLDVFRREPLAPEDPYWAHQKVTVTPHIAAETRASTASQVIAENIRRLIANEPLLHLVDRTAGY